MSTKADAVCLALVMMWQGTAGLSGVQVVDGPQANSDASDEWLFIGFDGDSPTDAAEAVTAAQDWMAYAKTKQETAEVTCAVVVRAGDTNIPAVRARAYANLSAAEDALRSDYTLGGTVLQSFISSHQYVPVITQGGCKARVVFTVTYLAQL